MTNSSLTGRNTGDTRTGPAAAHRKLSPRRGPGQLTHDLARAVPGPAGEYPNR
ncbi:hypothetical protein ACFVRD_40815 [Streptomyces sp. NPDC057908]|uniref:hypothetical protein n=1 Tax=unclassified Streptomyces TaxID=2593676 RepID=UPI002E11BF4A|nr:hypothetical protein OG609_00620 [Streptomyces sp. NBC_01224]